jgi:hypothetical protein
MAIIYPMRDLCDGGKFRLGLGFNFLFLNRTWGFDLGERFHKDPEYRVRTTMEIDRAVFDRYADLGLGYETPYPRPSVEPFGHRFVPAIYGSSVHFAKDSEPWAVACHYSREEVEALGDWTPGRFQELPAVRETVEQARCLHAKYGEFSSRPDLGSTINTGIYVMGDDLFVSYAECPEVVRKLYANVTQLMLLSLDYFPSVDRMPLKYAHIGNCCVSMISPKDYLQCHRDFDLQIIEYCRERGVPMTMHQDSDVNPHMDNYVGLPYVGSYDFGLDTDFERLARIAPDSDVSCMWFPHWLMSHDLGEIREKAESLIETGRSFRSFSCTLYEMDPLVGDEKLYALVAALSAAARKACAA